MQIPGSELGSRALGKKQDDKGFCLEGTAPRENERSKSPHVSEPAKKRCRVPLKGPGLKQLIGI